MALLYKLEKPCLLWETGATTHKPKLLEKNRKRGKVPHKVGNRDNDSKNEFGKETEKTASFSELCGWIFQFPTFSVFFPSLFFFGSLSPFPTESGKVSHNFTFSWETFPVFFSRLWETFPVFLNFVGDVFSFPLFRFVGPNFCFSVRPPFSRLWGTFPVFLNFVEDCSSFPLFRFFGPNFFFSVRFPSLVCGRLFQFFWSLWKTFPVFHFFGFLAQTFFFL